MSYKLLHREGQTLEDLQVSHDELYVQALPNGELYVTGFDMDDNGDPWAYLLDGDEVVDSWPMGDA